MGGYRHRLRAPMALPVATYWRLRLQERRDGVLVDRGYHHQPFATRAEAVQAVGQLYERVPAHLRASVHITVVQVNGQPGAGLGNR